MAMKEATEIGEPKAVTRCDNLYGCLFGHDKL